MTRTFGKWWSSLPNQLKENYELDKTPHLSHINYIWVTNLINNVSEELNPTIEELLVWIKSGQIDAKQRQ
jgi:hypothetical protein